MEMERMLLGVACLFLLVAVVREIMLVNKCRKWQKIARFAGARLLSELQDGQYHLIMAIGEAGRLKICMVEQIVSPNVTLKITLLLRLDEHPSAVFTIKDGKVMRVKPYNILWSEEQPPPLSNS